MLGVEKQLDKMTSECSKQELDELVAFMRKGLGEVMVELEQIQDWDRLLDQRLGDFQTNQQQVNSGTLDEILQLKKGISSAITSVDEFRRQQAEMGEKVEYLLKITSDYPKSLRFSSPFTPARRCQSYDCFTLGRSGSDRDSGIVALSERIKSRLPANFSQAVRSSDSDSAYGADELLAKSANKSLLFCQSLQQNCLALISSSEESDGEDQFTASDGEAEQVEVSCLSRETPYHSSTRILDCNASCQVTQEFFESSNHSVFCQTGDSLLANKQQCRNLNCPKIHSGFHRYQIVKELLDTERTYCAALSSIQDEFVRPLCESELISAKDLNIMFPDQLLRIYELHCVLLHKLEHKLLLWKDESTTIGDIILQFINPEASNLPSLYYDFVSDFPRVTKMLKKHFGKSSKLKKFLQQRRSQRSFESRLCPPLMLVLTPVQRIPRYALLLKELMKSTCEEHIDYQLLTDALEKLRWFLDRLNENMEHSFEMPRSPAIEPTKTSTPSLLPANHAAMASSSIYMEMNKTYEVNPITPISATGNKKNFSSEPILCADGYEEVFSRMATSTPNRIDTDNLPLPTYSPAITERSKLTVIHSKSVADLCSSETVPLPTRRRKQKNVVSKNLSAVKSFFMGAKKPERLGSDTSEKSNFTSHLISPHATSAKRSSSAAASYDSEVGLINSFCGSSPVPAKNNSSAAGSSVPFSYKLDASRTSENLLLKTSESRISPNSRDFSPDERMMLAPPLPPRLQTPFRPRLLKSNSSGGSGGKGIPPMKVMPTNWSSTDSTSADEKRPSSIIKITSVDQLEEEYVV